MGPSILVAQNLSKVVPSAEGDLTILHALSLDLAQGDSLAIVGASGSGKSTLLGLLAGLDRPSAGKVILAGHDLGPLDEDQRARVRAEHVGFVFQSFQLLDSLNALENVMLPLELDGRRDAREQAHTLLERVGLGKRLSHTPRQLSGGEQQRVAIARAFAAHPAVLFADEPTGNLDSTLAPDWRALSIIEARFCCNCCGGWPRSPSLPPSSSTTRLGLCAASSAGSRAWPPALVSPLIDALTT